VWHIGASGVVYAMAAFHFVSGIIRNDVRLLTLSVTVVFLYGGLIWGLLPINPEISWEGHLWGAISGIVLALIYKKYTIRRDKFDWEDEEEENQDVETDGKKYWEVDIEDDENHVKPEEKTFKNEQNKGLQKPDNMSHTGQY
jgi:hypothetical protein